MRTVMNVLAMFALILALGCVSRKTECEELVVTTTDGAVHNFTSSSVAGRLALKRTATYSRSGDVMHRA